MQTRSTPEAEKKCAKCKRKKPLSVFSKMASSTDGHQPVCKECDRERLRSRWPKSSPLAEKKCSACEQTKPSSDFHRCIRSPDGLERRCKPCRKKISAEYYESNKESIDRRNTEWQRNNRDKVAVIMNRFLTANPQPYDREAVVVRTRLREARKRQADGRFTKHEWVALKSQHGNCCLRCGAMDGPTRKTALVADHVIPISRGGTNYISNIQPLCWPCNAWKHTKSLDYRPGALPFCD